MRSSADPSGFLCSTVIRIGVTEISASPAGSPAHPRDPSRADLAGWLFGVVARHAESGLGSRWRRAEWALAIDDAERAFRDEDDDALDRLMRAGLARLAWNGEGDPPAGSHLRGGWLRVYEALTARGHTPQGLGAGPRVCVGTARSPVGCGVVFLAGRDASLCPRCQKLPIAFKPWGACAMKWEDRWQPSRTIVYGRVCECGQSFETTDPRREHCSARCRMRALRARRST